MLRIVLSMLTFAFPLSKQPPYIIPGPRVDLGYATYAGVRLANNVNGFFGDAVCIAAHWRSQVESPL